MLSLAMRQNDSIGWAFHTFKSFSGSKKGRTGREKEKDER